MVTLFLFVCTQNFIQKKGKKKKGACVALFRVNLSRTVKGKGEHSMDLPNFK